jgi:hypothetical protein
VLEGGARLGSDGVAWIFGRTMCCRIDRNDQSVEILASAKPGGSHGRRSQLAGRRAEGATGRRMMYRRPPVIICSI